MGEAMKGSQEASPGTDARARNRIRIQVSNTKKPVFFYVNLAKDCSSGACERNWSSYSLIHTKIRNRLKTTQLEKLVYCRANLRLLRKLKTLAGPMQRYMKQYGEVDLSGLGMAISTVVTIAEILKNNGLAVEKRICTSTIEIQDEVRQRPIQKAKVEILLAKSLQFDELMAVVAEDGDVLEYDDEPS